MRRTLENVTEMAQALVAERDRSSGTQRLYKSDNPGKNAAALASDIKERLAIVQTIDGRTKVDWNDLPTIQARVTQYMQACAQAGTFPSVQGMATHALGISRRRLNEYLAHNSNATTEYLECVKDVFADILMDSSLRNHGNVVMSIFVLKNNHNFRDNLEISAAPPSLSTSVDAAELQRQIDSLPDD